MTCLYVYYKVQGQIRQLPKFWRTCKSYWIIHKAKKGNCWHYFLFCSFTGRGLFLVKHFSVGIEVVFAFVWPDFSNELTRAAQPWPRVNTSLQISNAWHEILVCTVSNRPKNLAMGQKSGYTWLSLTTTTFQFNVLKWAEWKYKKVVLPSRLTYKYTLV